MNERVPLTDRFRDALTFASEAHNEQWRKGTTIPYVAHLLAVCALVLEHGGDEDEAIAALLHDTLEDQPDVVTPEILTARFGPRVAMLVQGCTDTPADYTGGVKPPWKERKQRYIAHMRREGAPFARVSLADKMHNARAILLDYRAIGDEIWKRFNVGRDDHLWYFRSLAEAYRTVGAPERMVAELERTIDEIGRLATSD